MQQIVFMIAMMLLLMTSCFPAAPPPTGVTSPANPSPEEMSNMPEESLAPELQQAFLKSVGAEQSLSPDALNIVKSEAADWPDACLGLSGMGEFCAQMITPGWAVTVTDGQQTWDYRTDLDMTQIRLAK